MVTDVGPVGLTLAAVAERVGLSAPALTQRFGSKHGLLVAFATREAADIADTFAVARAGQLAATTSPETLAADLYATYCGAMLTWAIDGRGDLSGWLTEHLTRTLAAHRAQ